MKVVQINATCGTGSTGKICVAISQLLSSKGIENYILYTQGDSDYSLGIKYADNKYIKVQALKSRIFGNGGFTSHRATKRLLSELERIDPDIIHIHNIHGHNCNLDMLFQYIKEKKKKVYWTFHDCWAFTANCPHFTLAECDKWKSTCYDCPQIWHTSWFFDRSEELHTRKKRLLSGVDLTIITPSKWLADCVTQSFLKGYNVKVIHNGIDLDVFKPTESDFRAKNGISTDTNLLLGVAFEWGKSKGLDLFVELAKQLPENYKIILVGTNDGVDRLLPDSVLSIHRTHNQMELAQIYSAANLFVNPTRGDTFPTVNIESLACGTPVLTFRTGGSPEIIDASCGAVVECDDFNSLKNEIIRICEAKPYTVEACTNRAKCYEMNARYDEYVRLFDGD